MARCRNPDKVPCSLCFKCSFWRLTSDRQEEDLTAVNGRLVAIRHRVEAQRERIREQESRGENTAFSLQLLAMYEAALEQTHRQRELIFKVIDRSPEPAQVNAGKLRGVSGALEPSDLS